MLLFLSDGSSKHSTDAKKLLNDINHRIDMHLRRNKNKGVAIDMLPIKRSTIVNNKVIVGLIYIISMIVIFTIFNYIGLTLSGEFDLKQFLLISITPIFPALVLYFMCMFISTFTHKTKRMLGVSLGFILISYFLQMLSTIAEPVEFLKYFSVFTLADLRNVIIDVRINPIMIIITIILSVLFYALTLIRYKKKELI